MSTLGKASSAMVYGIVQYDFQAERPDELDAKAGEAIIVIAQSNPEWFVAKPIGRLGGPGLIPVSFIELRDMQTGQAVTDPLEAVRRAGVPKVEEWKKMTAEYKNSSITLGKIDSAAAAANNMQSVTANMDKMSMSHQSNGHMSQNGNYYVSRRNLQALQQALIAYRAITIAMLAKIPSRTCPNRHRATNSPSLPPSPPRYRDIASITTSIGILLRPRWRMGAAGSCLDTTTISTTSRSPF
jgi:bud emergence protein 1